MGRGMKRALKSVPCAQAWLALLLLLALAIL
jgi:hypothetical protein